MLSVCLWMFVNDRKHDREQMCKRKKQMRENMFKFEGTV